MNKIIKLRFLLVLGVFVVCLSLFLSRKHSDSRNVEAVAIDGSALKRCSQKNFQPSVQATQRPRILFAWESYTVAEGESFSVIGVREWQLTPAEILSITELARTSISLNQLNKGQVIKALVDQTGELQQLKFSKKPCTDVLITREDGTFTLKEIKKIKKKSQRLYAGYIANNLSESMTKQGMPYAVAADAASLLNKKNNVRRDLRNGDFFEALILSDEIEGEHYAQRIGALRIRGLKVNTLLFLHEDGHYYNEQGKSLEPGFKRYPLASAYPVSSPFNLKRKHPVTGHVRPHKGTDFATPIGTHILSPAEGKVERVGYQLCTGHFLEVKHYNGYITRYFHLSKVLVNKGQSVAMGDIIGLTGNSGRSTGAHLHYELHKNGQPVDPEQVYLPLSKDLQGDELIRFQAGVSTKLAVLESYGGSLIASESAEFIAPKT